MTDDAREAAWNAVHDALPASWRVGPPTYSPADHHWSITAHDGTRGRCRTPVSVTGTGEDEVAAQCDLDGKLRGVPPPDGGRVEELWRRARLACVQGAMETWPNMTVTELERVIARVP